MGIDMASQFTAEDSSDESLSVLDLCSQFSEDSDSGSDSPFSDFELDSQSHGSDCDSESVSDWSIDMDDEDMDVQTQESVREESVGQDSVWSRL